MEPLVKVSPVVLGIDSSTRSTGWALLSLTQEPKLLDYGLILPDPKWDYLDRMVCVVEGIEAQIRALVNRQQGVPAIVAIEQPNTFTNAETVRQLCGLYGALAYAMRRDFGLDLIEVNTAHAKSVFCGKRPKGSGPAKKTDVLIAANKRFGLTLNMKAPGDNDLADAISIAYTIIQDVKDTPGFITN